MAAIAILFAAFVLLPRIFRAEGLYLFLPVLACAGVLFLPPRRDSTSADARSPLLRAGIGTAAAALPLACLLIPYVVQERLWDFVNGAVLLPRKRLAFASTPMPGALAIITGVPLTALVFAASRSPLGSRSILMKSLLWGVAIVLPLAALRNVVGYQVIWQSARLFAAILPLWICWRLVSGGIQHPEQQRPLFMLATMLAWASLNQFPFAAPIYFCYVAPLAVIAGIAAGSAESSFRWHTLLPWAVMLLLFAVFNANRGYIDNLGVVHAPRRFEAPLRLPRAHLKISEADARVYRRLVTSILLHQQNGQLIAGPDCPEVYFLTGLVSPSGTLFDFLSENPAAHHEDDNIADWARGDVIVVNHAPHFSPAPSDRLTASLRREFPYGEQIGHFEVRWR